MWKPTSDKPEIVGELLLAMRTNGDFGVQFTKPPIVIVDATSADGRWQVDFLVGKYTLHGKGSPTTRFVWFELPRALAGEELRRGWQFSRTNDLWRLECDRTGERLEGRFFQ